MNYQSAYQNPLNSMNYQFQNLSFENGEKMGNCANGVGGAAPQPLSRTASSLADAIGIQRAASPFVAQPQPQVPGQVSGQFQQSIEGTSPAVMPGPAQGPVAAAGLMNGWSQGANDSNMGSPYLVQNGLANLYPTGSPHMANLAMPPGVAQPQLPVLVESQWKYVDTQGQIQGPFSGKSMSQWYSSGYFQPSLQISRQGPTSEPFGINDRFILLAELIARVNDFRDPFTAFDRIVSSSQLSNLGTSAANGVSSSLAKNGVTHDSAIARVESNDFTHEEILQLEDKDGGYYREVLVQIPFSRNNKEKLDPTTQVNTRAPTREDSIKELPKKLDVNDSPEVTTEQEVTAKRVEAHGQPAKILKDESEKTAASIHVVDDIEEAQLRRQQKAEEMARKLLQEQERQEEELQRREELRKLKKQQKQKSKEAGETVTENQAKNNDSAKASYSLQGKETLSTAHEIISPVAPWANKTKNFDAPKISIPELRRKEELEQAKRTQQRESMERMAAMKLQEQIMKEDKADEELRSKLTWATKTIPPPVSIAIKPQLKNTPDNKADMKKKNILTEETNNASLNELEDPNFIKEQKKLWEEAQRSKSKASTGPNPPSNAWTTVTSKSSVVSKQSKITTQPKSVINPKKLRAASVAPSKQIGSSTSIPSLRAKYTGPVSYPGNSSIAVRQEFLKWCRSQMKLSPNVSVTSVLEVLLSLPAGLESKEIIADTIYSNSSTMDGRRFALEFIKKRVECEKQIKDPLTWSEALALPEGNEDDWEFQVVSKKKGRKH